MRGHPRRCTGASSADLCRFLRLRHECRGRFALACGGAGCAAPKSPPRLITCGCRASGLPCRTLPRDHPWVQAARRRRALRQGLAAQLARRVLAVPAALEVRQDRPTLEDRRGRAAGRTVRAWSGLAASGKAERHYHRANAQDLPYRLRHPTFWAAPADESAAGLDSTLVRELLFPMLVFGLPARPDIQSGARIRREQCTL